jgi:hypothetical protein
MTNVCCVSCFACRALTPVCGSLTYRYQFICAATELHHKALLAIRDVSARQQRMLCCLRAGHLHFQFTSGSLTWARATISVYLRCNRKGHIRRGRFGHVTSLPCPPGSHPSLFNSLPDVVLTSGTPHCCLLVPARTPGRSLFLRQVPSSVVHYRSGQHLPSDLCLHDVESVWRDSVKAQARRYTTYLSGNCSTPPKLGALPQTPFPTDVAMTGVALPAGQRPLYEAIGLTLRTPDRGR